MNFAQASKKKIGRFLKKTNGLLFFRFDNCRPLEGGMEQMSPVPSFLIQTCWDP